MEITEFGVTSILVLTTQNDHGFSFLSGHQKTCRLHGTSDPQIENTVKGGNPEINITSKFLIPYYQQYQHGDHEQQ